MTPSSPMLNQPDLVESDGETLAAAIPGALTTPTYPSPLRGTPPELTGDAVGHVVIDAFVAIHRLHLQHRGSLGGGWMSAFDPLLRRSPLPSTPTTPTHTKAASSATEAE